MSIGILVAVERECFNVRIVEDRGVPGIEWEMVVPRRDLMITLAIGKGSALGRERGRWDEPVGMEAESEVSLARLVLGFLFGGSVYYVLSSHQRPVQEL